MSVPHEQSAIKGTEDEFNHNVQEISLNTQEIYLDSVVGHLHRKRAHSVPGNVYTET